MGNKPQLTPFTEEWEQRESNNGGSEYMKNFQLYQFVQDKENELEEESQNKGNGNGTAKENKTESEEPAQSPASAN